MLLFRAALLATLVVLHVLGGALLFRKFFPRESPWWGFFAPMLALVSGLNFIEHLVALPDLFWLLPFTLSGLVWLVWQRDGLVRRLWLPGVLFVVIFLFAFAVKCIQPDINFYNTEGLTNLNRILDFCLGDKVPPRDCWLPPYPHTSYYTFMHYGASVLKRLLMVDIGTADNLSSALLSAFTMLAGAAAAYSLSRHRVWVAVVMMVVLAGGFTGSTPIQALLHPHALNPFATIDIGQGAASDTVHREFAWFLHQWPSGHIYRLYTPGCYIYYSEFHATMAGHFLALLTVFGASEVLRRKRTYLPWVFLLLAPGLAFLSCSWFVFIVGLLAGPTLVLAWWLGRRPPKWSRALLGAGLGTALLAPSIRSLLAGATHQPFYWTRDAYHDIGTVLVQWWPIYMPWLALCFAWPRMQLTGRWLHFLLIPICLCVELFFFTERGTNLEKSWGGTFGVGLVILYPVLFSLRGWVFRALSGVLMLTGLISLWSWTSTVSLSLRYPGAVMHLEGEHYFSDNPQLLRMEQVLGQIRNQTVLTGVNHYAFFESPALPAFTDNQSFLGWTNAEETAGHPNEAHDRQEKINAFYAGTLPAPLDFLKANDIAAVLVWPDDHLSPEWVKQMKATLEPDYTYFDCQGDGENLAGVFLRKR